MCIRDSINAEYGGCAPKEMEVDLQVCDAFHALDWWSGPSDEYHIPATQQEETALKAHLHTLPNGACLPCRGRDIAGTELTKWDYGYLVKRGSRLFFLYESGDMENFRIDWINFSELVHLARRRHPESMPSPPESLGPTGNVVLLAHGFSEEDGPNYALIRTLEHAAEQLGWRAIVPDFRGTYAYGSARGRSERVRAIYEELLCLEPPAKRVVLVGHSQGGAAAAHACTDRVVSAQRVRGLMMLGSESPMSHDGMDWTPQCEQIHIVHALGDNVIGVDELRRCAAAWQAQMTELESTVPKGAADCWGDDINHDFLAKDLMVRVVELFRDCLLYTSPSPRDS
eukprot:TRINITY_DN5383_c0_g1_i1.p1 TRINITY_DN5383_c0_g1~~TRINITY_DN5383_c0_g1_i1.p1  ORF type:complete len:341 (+),score=59.47 TRINITY_DN5383_c0_g1_i1:198-1220(+)